MRVAYFDCPMGASGDMILGALIDVGLSGDRLSTALAELNLPGYVLTWDRVMKGPIAATQASVEVTDTRTPRHLSDIEALLDAADIPASIRVGAKAVFGTLADIEAGIHGTTTDKIHFHELGAIDTIVDVVGALWGLEMLEVEEVYASALPAARGWIRSEHGTLPLPAPATLSLLRGVPLVPAPVDGELVTPTGAALLGFAAKGFGPPPALTLRRIGYGAGRKDFTTPTGDPGPPNVLRVWLGEIERESMLEPLLMLETNIDDMNPQLFEHVAQRLFAAGALDVTLTAVQMKKNRPGTLLSTLCSPEEADSLSEIIFRETTTLGIRRIPLQRQALPRYVGRVKTPHGSVRTKAATLPDGSVRASPEYDDCRLIAEKTGEPLRLIMDEAQRAIDAGTRSSSDQRERRDTPPGATLR